MAKIRPLKPRVATLPQRVGPASRMGRDLDSLRREREPWRRWYNTARWRRLRIETFTRDLFVCQMCGRLEGKTHLLVGDHITRHRGGPEKFWDPDNLQILCKSPCHDKHKQAREKAARLFE
ncbi:MAG: HNH endonuclease [Hyphomicrobiales bacterium]|nr:HNH endonuclease [Hyphomicrobiales bacterium]